MYVGTPSLNRSCAAEGNFLQSCFCGNLRYGVEASASSESRTSLYDDSGFALYIKSLCTLVCMVFNITRHFMVEISVVLVLRVKISIHFVTFWAINRNVYELLAVPYQLLYKLDVCVPLVCMTKLYSISSLMCALHYVKPIVISFHRQGSIDWTLHEN